MVCLTPVSRFVLLVLSLGNLLTESQLADKAPFPTFTVNFQPLHKGQACFVIFFVIFFIINDITRSPALQEDLIREKRMFQMTC